jgi:hypothetical protein
LLTVGYVRELTDEEAERSGLDVYWRPKIFFSLDVTRPRLRLDFF